MILAELRQEATMEKAFQAPKMYIVAQRIGEKELHKLLCFILKDFQDSLKITNPANVMTASEIFDVAGRLMGMGDGEFGRESVFDIIMALKRYKQKPFELFNSFSDAKVMTIITNYLTEKADFLERANGQGGREARNREPLSFEMVQQEYDRARVGLPTVGQLVEAARKEQDYKNPRNWRDEPGYREYLNQRFREKHSGNIEDTDHEDITNETSSTQPGED